MVASTGSSPARLRPDAALRWLLFALALAVPATGTPLPDYLRTALTAFSPDVPPGWAYTLTTTRNGVRMVERFAPPSRWSLLEWQGRPPTADEQEKYLRSRPQGESGGTRANFRRQDIEPGTLQLVHEDAAGAEWTGGFRSTSAGADKMLGHLLLTLIVSKDAPHVTAYRLRLDEPYSPVLGVKMNRLDVAMTYFPPTADRPALPATQTSHFTGRVFFVSTQEELEVSFSDYAQPGPEQSR